MQEHHFPAPAKINLYLSITGKRKNGYHLLDSLFVFTNVQDSIYVSKSNEFSFSVECEDGQKLEADSNNLVYKSAYYLADYLNTPCLAKIRLIKRLPVSSGIGGGSTDAGATLRALNFLWQGNLQEEDLAKIGLKLGADIPSCVYAKPCLVSGIGENINPIKIPFDLFVILVNPRKAVSTPEIFRLRKEAFSNKKDFLFNDKTEFLNNLKSRTNDLYVPACELLPEIEDIVKYGESLEGCLLSRMSGSGATCFYLFDDIDKLNKAKNIVKQEFPSYWVASGKII